jgi:hypothetical protein
MAKEEKKTVVAAKAPNYKLAVNEARGEARLVIDGVELVLAATLQGLAAVSSRLQCKSLSELYQRMSGVEVGAVWVAIELLTIKGDVTAALEKLGLKHFTACGIAFTAILAHHFVGEEGNEEAVDEAA